jgi:uncharacterized membrane protein YoaK (UPF0700 family)
MMLGFAMGFHNGLALEIIPDCPATTVMTMTIVKVSMNAADACQYYLASKSIIKLYQIQKKKPTDYEKNMSNSFSKASKKLQSLYEPLLLFITGAITGAAVNRGVVFFSLVIPLLLTLLITVDIYRTHTGGGASLCSSKSFNSNSSSIDGDILLQYTADNPLQSSVESKIAIIEGSGTV